MIKPFINEKVLKEFEPLYTRVELEIKRLIRDYVMLGKSQYELTKKINVMIEEFRDKLPKELPNHSSYVRALYQSSGRWLKEFQSKVNAVNMGLIFLVKPQGKYEAYEPIKPIVENMQKAIRYQGTPQVANYQKELKKVINELAQSSLLDEFEQGKRRTSIFAKAELDLRHKDQMEKVASYKANGEYLKRFSTHASASERCEKWQGKLVHLLLPPINNSMETGERYNGEKIYSYDGITNKVDKYGYKNNITVGWNCRHKMIDPDYKDNIADYTKEEIEESRKVNAKMRELERTIRGYRKGQYLAPTKQEQRVFAQKARETTKQYQSYATSNNVAMAKWRFTIPQDLRGKEVLMDY